MLEGEKHSIARTPSLSRMVSIVDVYDFGISAVNFVSEGISLKPDSHHATLQYSKVRMIPEAIQEH